MTFISEQAVRFSHIDAAGIVFYPRYFEMLNASIEDYFAQHIGVDFKTIHLDRKLGVPTVKLEADFVAPSRLGDHLLFHVRVVKVGRSSVEFAIEVRCGDETRFHARVVLVCMDLAAGRSLPWPDDMRPREAVAA
jgi:4-hydroxybenzoyl-CoA thioesterase